jgi:hypothetical protein
MKRWLMITLALVFALAGCNFGNVDVQRNGDGSATVTATMSEADVNAIIQEALARAGNPLLRNPQVDLQDGQLVINGEHEKRDGSGTVSGTMTATVTAQNGALLAQITSLNIEGVDIGDARVAELNQRLADGFTRRANRDNRQVTVQSVTVANDSMVIVLNVTRA